MVNIYDDHDIIDGFGSYPHHFMKCAVFSNLGRAAFRYYLLFQHQSTVAEGPTLESWDSSIVLGPKPGPYMNELSRSIVCWLGTDVLFLGRIPKNVPDVKELIVGLNERATRSCMTRPTRKYSRVSTKR